MSYFGFTYGFREGHSAHQALASLREGCYQGKVGVIIDADVSKFFDKMPHDRIRELLRKRMNDGKVLWLPKNRMTELVTYGTVGVVAE